MEKMKRQIYIIFLIVFIPTAFYANSLPLAKIYKSTGSSFVLQNFKINITSNELVNEKSILQHSLEELGFENDVDGIMINLVLSDIELPIEQNHYKDEIYRQGYHLQINADEIKIESPTKVGIYYGVQTFLSLCKSDSLLEADIKDWPDFPVRMIMVDPARQHENKDYFKRLIEFCGQYKINQIQIHLTDHQTSCLYNKDFPELMHPNAWKNDDIIELKKIASMHHIKLVPEIESFGHSRMFTRLKDATDYLHQTEMMESDSWWIIIDIPGYTNMLCPASDKAIKYLEEMYREATAFGSDQIHIGFDEVDVSNCKRCNEKFGKISGPQLFQKHLNHCIQIASTNYDKVGIWGDMLLKYPEILDSIPKDKVIIYDWNYYPDIPARSVNLFLESGFEVIACPALMCWPYIIMPSENNYKNIRNFISLAREKELLGVNTTLWVPQRYLSDAMWIGIAYAAEQSWGGSNWNDNDFLGRFLSHYFGSNEKEQFIKTWNLLITSIVSQEFFVPGCWKDEETLDKAKNLLTDKSQSILMNIDNLKSIKKELFKIGASVKLHQIEWKALETSAEIQLFVLEHLAASKDIKINNEWNIDSLNKLDVKCKSILDEIEKDWDRNRFPDDPNKNGLYQPHEHLLYNFAQMHQFHQTILRKAK